MATDVYVEAPPISTPASVIAWRRLVTGGTIVVLGSVIANVLSFLFSFGAARLLSPNDFATLTAALSLMVIVAVPATTLQFVAARYSAIWGIAAPGKAKTLARWLGRIALIAGLAVGVGVVLLSRQLAQYLQIPTTLPVLVISGVLACSFVGPAYRGLLQGHHRFGGFAVVSSSEYAIRLAAGLLLMAVGLREIGALLGVFAGAGLAAGLAWWSSRKSVASVPSAPVLWRPVLQWAFPTLIVQAALTALLFQDTLLAKHFFGSSEAGDYAGLATTARALVYFAGALGIFLFPVVARSHATGGRGRMISHITVTMVIAVQAVLLLLYATIPKVILGVAVGSQYVGSSAYLPLLGVGLAAYAVINILVTYLLATGNRVFLLPLLVSPVIEAFLLSRNHSSLGVFIHTLDAVMLATLAVLFCIYLWPGNRVGYAGAEEPVHLLEDEPPGGEES